MKKIALALVVTIVAFTSVPAFAGGLHLELERFVSESGEVSPATATLLGTTQFGESRYGASVFALIGKGWGQFYVGPTMTLKTGGALVILGTGIGAEQGSDGLRSGSSVVVIKDKHLAVGVYETTLSDGSLGNHFYIAQYAYQASGSVRVGAYARRYSGVGPRIDVSIPGTKAGLWAAPLYDVEFGSCGGLVVGTLDF